MHISRISPICAAVAARIVLLILPLSQIRAQSAPQVRLVKMVAKPGGHFAFEPAAITAQHGDTVRFVQASTAPHNVHFVKTPKGAHFGKAMSGPYVIGAAGTYNIVIDAKFVDGTYEFVCDPHESVGMRGSMTVGPSAK